MDTYFTTIESNTQDRVKGYSRGYIRDDMHMSLSSPSISWSLSPSL